MDTASGGPKLRLQVLRTRQCCKQPSPRPLSAGGLPTLRAPSLLGRGPEALSHSLWVRLRASSSVPLLLRFHRQAQPPDPASLPHPPPYCREGQEGGCGDGQWRPVVRPPCQGLVSAWPWPSSMTTSFLTPSWHLNLSRNKGPAREQGGASSPQTGAGGVGSSSSSPRHGLEMLLTPAPQAAQNAPGAESPSWP